MLGRLQFKLQFSGNKKLTELGNILSRLRFRFGRDELEFDEDVEDSDD